MEESIIEIEEGAANPFAKGGLVRSPPSQLGQQQRNQEEQQVQRQLQQQQQQQPREQQQQLQQQQQAQVSAWSKVPKLPRVVAAKKLVDELHEFVDKRSNVHKDIKTLVLKIQGTLGLAVKEWAAVAQKVESTEKELSAAKTALEIRQVPIQQTAMPITFARETNAKRDKSQRTESVPFTPKRPRASPGDARPGGSKKHKDTRVNESGPANAATTKEGNDTPWEIVKAKNRKTKTKSRSEKQSLFKGRKRGEALIVKASDDSYEKVLRAMRTNPELEQLGADVRKVRRTRTGDMILELKRDPMASSSSYKELAEKAMGNTVEVRAVCPEAVLECKNLDAISTDDDVRVAMKEQCMLGEVQMQIRIRKGPSGMLIASIRLPIEAAVKALKTEKIKVGWSVCPLSVSQKPEACYRCHEYGHLARFCKGPDRGNLCRRCGEEGHKAQACRKPPKCMICANGDNNNHVTGGLRCPAFMKATATKPQWR